MYVIWEKNYKPGQLDTDLNFPLWATQTHICSKACSCIIEISFRVIVVHFNEKKKKKRSTIENIFGKTVGIHSISVDIKRTNELCYWSKNFGFLFASKNDTQLTILKPNISFPFLFFLLVFLGWYWNILNRLALLLICISYGSSGFKFKSLE